MIKIIKNLDNLVETNSNVFRENVLFVAGDAHAQKPLLRHIKTFLDRKNPYDSHRNVILRKLLNGAPVEYQANLKGFAPNWRCVTMFQLGMVLWRNAKKLPKVVPAASLIKRTSQQTLLRQLLLVNAVPPCVSNAVKGLANSARRNLVIPQTVGPDAYGLGQKDSLEIWEALYERHRSRLGVLDSRMKSLIIESARKLLYFSINSAGGGAYFHYPWHSHVLSMMNAAQVSEHLAAANGEQLLTQPDVDSAALERVALGHDLETIKQYMFQKPDWDVEPESRYQEQLLLSCLRKPPYSMTEIDSMYLPVVHNVNFPKFDKIVIPAIPNSSLKLVFYQSLVKSGHVSDIYLM